MAERPSLRRRVLIEDTRLNGSFLRTTWHPEADQFVVSTWTDELCTGAVRLPAARAAELICLLADGLAESAATPPMTPAGAEVVAPPARHTA